MYCELRPDDAARTSAIVENERLPEHVRERGLQRSREVIGAAAGREWNDDSYRLRRISVRRFGCARCSRKCRKCEQDEACARTANHSKLRRRCDLRRRIAREIPASPRARAAYPSPPAVNEGIDALKHDCRSARWLSP